MLAAQRREARMHLRGHRSRHRARGIVGGPECVAAGLLREIFDDRQAVPHHRLAVPQDRRSEEHTSELQSLMRISYAVFCLKKKNKINHPPALPQVHTTSAQHNYTNTVTPT